MEFRFSTGYFSLPNELIEKWAWTGLDFSALAVLCAFLKHAHGSKTECSRGQRNVAAELGLSERQVIRVMRSLEERRMIAIDRPPGRSIVVDLNPLKDYLATLSAPCGIPVDNPVSEMAESRTTPDMGVRGGGDMGVRGVRAEKREKTLANRERASETRRANKQVLKKQEPCRNKDDQERPEEDGGFSEPFFHGGASPDSAPPASRHAARPEGSDTPQAPPSSPVQPSPERRSEGLVALAIGQQARDSLPPEVFAWRKQLLDAATSHGVGTPLQAVETMLRQELRSRECFGIKTSRIHDLFVKYPVDGILHWATQAYRSARDRPAWLIGILERTGGEYHGRARSGAA